VSDELNEKADELESWADTIEDTDFDEFEYDDPDDFEVDEDDDRPVAEQIADLRKEWIVEQRDRLIDAVGECPL
jgi:hypothetical protein